MTMQEMTLAFNYLIIRKTCLFPCFHNGQSTYSCALLGFHCLIQFQLHLFIFILLGFVYNMFLLSVCKNLQFCTSILELNCSDEVVSQGHPGAQGVWDLSAIPVLLQVISILDNINYRSASCTARKAIQSIQFAQHMVCHFTPTNTSTAQMTT